MDKTKNEKNNSSLVNENKNTDLRKSFDQDKLGKSD